VAGIKVSFADAAVSFYLGTNPLSLLSAMESVAVSIEMGSYSAELNSVRSLARCSIPGRPSV
jgi:hypothetical protein